MCLVFIIRSSSYLCMTVSLRISVLFLMICFYLMFRVVLYLHFLFFIFIKFTLHLDPAFPCFWVQLCYTMRVTCLFLYYITVTQVDWAIKHLLLKPPHHFFSPISLLARAYWEELANRTKKWCWSPVFNVLCTRIMMPSCWKAEKFQSNHH